MWMAAAAVVLGLAGCAIGAAPGGGALSGSFEVATPYRQAYQAARQQAERCLVGEGGYQVVGGLDDGARTGLVRVVPRLVDGEMARVEVSALDAGRSRVRVSMWGRSLWNDEAMRAMHDAVVFGVPSCGTYMPGGAKDQDWFQPAR